MPQPISRDNENLFELVLCRKEGKISTELDGETVILDLVSGMYSGLDQVGTAIWNLLEKPVFFKVIVTEIVDAYDVTEEQCIADLLEFLNSLFENGLIVVQQNENL
jgi:hypothetical protein